MSKLNPSQHVIESGLNSNLSVLCTTRSLSTWLCCLPKQIEDQICMTTRNWMQACKIHQPTPPLKPPLFCLLYLPPAYLSISASPQISPNMLHKIRHFTVLTITSWMLSDHISKVLLIPGTLPSSQGLRCKWFPHSDVSGGPHEWGLFSSPMISKGGCHCQGPGGKQSSSQVVQWRFLNAGITAELWTGFKFTWIK